MSKRIPITVLSGYLGSGKTTIINHVLARTRGMKLAVLVNDFGAINIDAALIENTDGDTIELTNGCVCCTIGDDLGATLQELAMRTDPPERALLEASGVAEPARVSLFAGHWPGFELDSVIVAADAETVRARSRDKFVGKLVRSQLQSADVIALTKTDLVGPEKTAEVRQWLTTLDPGHRIFEAPHGRVPPEIIFHSESQITGSRPEALSAAHAQFSTACWRPRGPVDPDKLRHLLQSLPGSVHRAKGVVIDATTGEGLLVQCVGRRCELTPAPVPDEPSLVMISTAPQVELTALCAGFDQVIES